MEKAWQIRAGVYSVQELRTKDVSHASLLFHYCCSKLRTWFCVPLRHTAGYITNMSWLMNPHGDAPVRSGATDEDMSPKVPDPNIADRTVSTKPANQPFIACVLIHHIICPRLTARKGTRSIGTNARLNIKLGKNVWKSEMRWSRRVSRLDRERMIQQRRWKLAYGASWNLSYIS